MIKFSPIFGAVILFYVQVYCAPTPELRPGGALQQTTYCANYTSKGSNAPCASISGQHIVTQHCQESSLTEALQEFLKTVCTVVNAASNGPDNKKLDVCVSSNMTYVPTTYGKGGDRQGTQAAPGTIPQGQQPPSSSDAEEHEEHEDEDDDPEGGHTEEEENVPEPRPDA